MESNRKQLMTLQQAEKVVAIFNVWFSKCCVFKLVNEPDEPRPYHDELPTLRAAGWFRAHESLRICTCMSLQDRPTDRPCAHVTRLYTSDIVGDEF
jgi:hypothetical protein